MLKTSRSFIIDLIEQGKIPSGKVEQALEIAGIRPTTKQWSTFVGNLFLWLGSISIALSVVFFVAFNWSDLGKFSKFALAEVSIGISILAYLFVSSKDTKKYTEKSGTKEVFGQLFLLLASIFLGVLLALFGQIYQTGADPWELFFYWAILILPWAFISRFVVMWILFIALINLSGSLYIKTFNLFRDDIGIIAVFFLVNALFLLIWEVSSLKFNWLNADWAKRLIFIPPSFLITTLAMFLIFEGNQYSVEGYKRYILLIICWFIVTLYFYRFARPNLFMLAIWCFSLSTILISILVNKLFSYSIELYDLSNLILVVVIITLTGVSVIWLRKINKELSNVK